MADDSSFQSLRLGQGQEVKVTRQVMCAICNKGLWTVSFLDHYIEMAFRLYSTIMRGEDCKEVILGNERI